MLLDRGRRCPYPYRYPTRIEVLPAASARAPTIAMVAATVEDLVRSPGGLLFDARWR